MLTSVFTEINFRLRNKGKPGPTRPLYTGTANTALGPCTISGDLTSFCVEFHDRRLLALVENDLPVHVTVPALTTVGHYTYESQLQHMFTGAPPLLHRC